MKAAHLIPVRVTKWHPRTTRQRPGARIAPNVLNQDFQAAQPNEKWVGDVTYIDTAEGWLYLAAILDLYSRWVVGWAMSEKNDADLVEKAWRMAVTNRRPPRQILHHSDRGCQYTSLSYLKLLEQAGCRLSMSRTGNCYDNAVMESFFATLKGECAVSQFASRAEARSAIFEFIEVWYNRQRLHSSLGYLSPVNLNNRQDINRVHFLWTIPVLGQRKGDKAKPRGLGSTLSPVKSENPYGDHILFNSRVNQDICNYATIK